MKQLLALLLALALMAVFTACGPNKPDDQSNEEVQPSEGSSIGVEDEEGPASEEEPEDMEEELEAQPIEESTDDEDASNEGTGEQADEETAAQTGEEEADTEA